jgi:uncharacterized protein YciI
VSEPLNAPIIDAYDHLEKVRSKQRLQANGKVSPQTTGLADVRSIARAEFLVAEEV